MREVVIYRVKDWITGKMYIGQTTNLKQRWEDHCKLSKVNKSLLSEAINKYGRENFFLIKLERCTKNEALKREAHWVAKLNTKYPCGYNISDFNGARKIKCITNNCIYPSTKIAGKELGINRCNITSCLKGNRKTAGGHKFEYVKISKDV